MKSYFRDNARSSNGQYVFATVLSGYVYSSSDFGATFSATLLSGNLSVHFYVVMLLSVVYFNFKVHGLRMDYPLIPVVKLLELFQLMDMYI